MLYRLQSGLSAFNPSFNRIKRCKREQPNSRLSLQLIGERSSIEIFADKGSLLITAVFFPAKLYRWLRISAISERIKAVAAKYTAIKPIMQSAN
jgi:sucrose-6-phosphate hydrolase SacC (GH32 family)